MCGYFGSRIFLFWRENERMTAMAIEASKFTEKDELIAKFYTLRAGLSVIAEETEKIKAAEKELEAITAKNNENNKNVQQEYLSKSNHYRNEINVLQNYSASSALERNIEEHQQELTAVERNFPKFSVGIAIGTFFGIFFLLGIVFTMMSDLTSPSFTPTILAMIGAFIIAIIVGYKHAERVIEQEQASIYTKLAKAREALRNTKEAEKKKLSKLKADFVELERSTRENTDIYKGDIEIWEAKLNKEILPACTSAAQAIKTAMLDSSKGIISEADWANIDLLIFYLETGRADSLKEALQLVDNQRQTDQITHAMYEASNHIVTTLSERLNWLGSVIQTEFAHLGSQIQFNHNRTLNTMLTAFGNLEDTINAGKREISQQLDSLSGTITSEGERISKAEQLNASLLKKANESSDQLMYELRYNQKYWKTQ